jgi:hypothetical protein
MYRKPALLVLSAMQIVGRCAQGMIVLFQFVIDICRKRCILVM